MVLLLLLLIVNDQEIFMSAKLSGTSNKAIALFYTLIAIISSVYFLNSLFFPGPFLIKLVQKTFHKLVPFFRHLSAASGIHFIFQQ